jgi:hypothetical protein
MEVDHFDPRTRNNLIQQYEDFLLAHRHCNNRKRRFFPTPEQQALGIRLINPCLEHDYGVHLFEDLSTGMLVSTTPPGITQIRRLGLNDDFLVRLRRRRTELFQIVEELRGAGVEEITIQREIVNYGPVIPIIPPPPLP